MQCRVLLRRRNCSVKCYFLFVRFSGTIQNISGHFQQIKDSKAMSTNVNGEWIKPYGTEYVAFFAALLQHRPHGHVRRAHVLRGRSDGGICAFSPVYQQWHTPRMLDSMGSEVRRSNPTAECWRCTENWWTA